MKISIIVEGKTERVFMAPLREFLRPRLTAMPALDPVPHDGRIPTDAKLKRLVVQWLRNSDAVIALTDVYTGSQPPEFENAADAKARMRTWVGNEPRFHPHAAQFDFEAWLLPYWEKIKELAGSNRVAPGSNPETVNHMNPPAHRIREVFRTGNRSRAYVKPRDAGRILRGENLLDSVQQCSELKAFVNTILSLCNGNLIP